MQEMFNNLKEKILNEDTWIAIGTGLLKIMAIMILSAIVLRIGKLIIKNIFLVRAKAPIRFSERREATLKKLLENMLTYVVYFIAIIMILPILSIEVKPLLAGAGIVGLAVGFGAQSLVKDIISGFFIIFEDQFSVGDHVRVGQFEGTVEEIGLRTTKIKNWTGELHIIPNGSISEVTNFSLYNSVAVVDVSIAYNEDIERAEKVIQDFLKDLPDRYEDIVKPPELLGVQNIGTSEVVLRIVAETLPMKHFNIARMLRRELKVLLEAHGFDIPFPRLVMYSRSDEQGEQKQLGKE